VKAVLGAEVRHQRLLGGGRGDPQVRFECFEREVIAGQIQLIACAALERPWLTQRSTRRGLPLVCFHSSGSRSSNSARVGRCQLKKRLAASSGRRARLPGMTGVTSRSEFLITGPGKNAKSNSTAPGTPPGPD